MPVTVDVDSYVTEAELLAYATARGITLVANQTVLLIKAMDYLESLNYKGARLSSVQVLSWPRDGVYIDGYELDSDDVPQQVKNAQMATAISIDSGVDPLSDLQPSVKREKADVVEIEYQAGASPVTLSRSISAALRPLLANGSGAANFTVTRA